MEKGGHPPSSLFRSQDVALAVLSSSYFSLFIRLRDVFRGLFLKRAKAGGGRGIRILPIWRVRTSGGGNRQKFCSPRSLAWEMSSLLKWANVNLPAWRAKLP